MSGASIVKRCAAACAVCMISPGTWVQRHCGCSAQATLAATGRPAVGETPFSPHAANFAQTTLSYELMSQRRSTIRETDVEEQDGPGEKQAQPGLAVIFSGGSPQWRLIPIPLASPAGDDSGVGELELGRDTLGTEVGDGRISRRHALVRYHDGAFSATDLGSLNGTTVDGRRMAPRSECPIHRCLRLGDTLLIPVLDRKRFERAGLTVSRGIVIGPRLSNLYARISRLAAVSTTLHITGESGAGKENAARAFHAASPAHGAPFVAVNCATIPESIAERLLFGAKRGAFSGVVADSDGYVQAAHRGTLFLDEVTELHATVQAKLLRVLEAREVLPVGSTRPQQVDIRICSASHRSLQSEVAAGRLREDLYYRIGRPSERVPSLRERPEEIPWLIHGELQKSAPGLSAHVSLVEACVMRDWPGNVRELLVETRTAAQEAIAAAESRVKSEHLADAAGRLIASPASALVPDAATASASPSAPPRQAEPPATTGSPSGKGGPGRLSRPELIATLLETGCNVSAAARQLGLHRTELRRQLEFHGIDVRRLRQLEKSLPD